MMGGSQSLSTGNNEWGRGEEGTLKTHDARDINRLKKAHTLCTAHDGKKDRGWKKITRKWQEILAQPQGARNHC